MPDPENTSPVLDPENTSSDPVETAGGSAPDVGDTAQYESIMSVLEGEESPWRVLELLRERDLPPQLRARFLPLFFSLVARVAALEQDSLLAHGANVFRYRMDTARQEVEQLREEGAGSITKYACSVIGPDFIAEIILTADRARPVKFMKYIVDTGNTEIVDQLTMDDTLYIPPQSELVEKGTIILPTGIEEYGTEQDLYMEVRHFIASFLHIDNIGFRNVLAFYVFLTWVYDRFDVVPYLRAIGDFGTGKTRLLKTLGHLCYRATMAGGATTASPVFRIIERYKGTLIIDEADFAESDLWSEVVKILNQGYERGSPVLRAERTSDEGFDVKAYDTFCPKILATRKTFKDQALESRCLTHTMPTLLSIPDDIPLVLDSRFRNEAVVLRNKLLLWRFHRFFHATVDPMRRIPGIGTRLNQIVLPLLAAVADERMQQAILANVDEHQHRLGEARRESLEGLIAAVVIQRWQSRQFPDRVLLKTVTEQVNMDREGDHKIEGRKIGEIVRSTFGLDTRRVGGNTWLFASDDSIDRLATLYSMPLAPRVQSDNGGNPHHENPTE